MVQHGKHTDTEGSTRTRARQVSPCPIDRKKTEAPTLHNLRFPDTSRWVKHTCERVLAARMPVDTQTRRKDGFLNQQWSHSRENTCCGRKRDTHASWFAKQSTLSRQRHRDHRADNRAFPCVTQPCVDWSNSHWLNSRMGEERRGRRQQFRLRRHRLRHRWFWRWWWRFGLKLDRQRRFRSR